jgi:hypothetical protein
MFRPALGLGRSSGVTRTGWNKEQAGIGIHALESLGFCRKWMDIEPLQGDAPIERGGRADPRVER